MASKISINLDTSKENYLVAKCKQNDDLTLEANIYENGLALDLTNKDIVIQALKADKTYIIQSTDITKANNKIEANLVRDFSRLSGKTLIEIVLRESGKQNTTFSFYLEVVGSVIKGAVESSNTVTILESLENKIVEAEAVKEETEQLITLGGAATKGDVQELNASLEQITNVLDLLVVNDGITDNTTIIQTALNRSNHVKISKKGTYIVRRLTIHDNTTFELADGVILKQKDNNSDYIIVNDKWRSKDGTYNTNIKIIGGQYDINASKNPRTGAILEGLYAGIGIVLNNVKNLEVRNIKEIGNAIKYCALFANIENGIFANINCINESDGLHFQAPCKNIKINNISGACHDNLLPFTIGDYPAITISENGDFDNIEISNVYSKKDVDCIDLIRLVGNGKNKSGKFRNFKIKNVQGNPSANQPLIQILNDDQAFANDYLNGTYVENIEISNIKNTNGTYASLVGILGTVENISIDNVTIVNDVNGNVLNISAKAKVFNISLSNISIRSSATNYFLIGNSQVSNSKVSLKSLNVYIPKGVIYMDYNEDTTATQYITNLDINSCNIYTNKHLSVASCNKTYAFISNSILDSPTQSWIDLGRKTYLILFTKNCIITPELKLNIWGETSITFRINSEDIKLIQDFSKTYLYFKEGDLVNIGQDISLKYPTKVCRYNGTTFIEMYNHQMLIDQLYQKIGGENLLKLTKEFNPQTYPSIWQKTGTIGTNINILADKINGFTVLNVIGEWNRVFQSIDVKPNTKYTMSAWIKSDIITTLRCTFTDAENLSDNVNSTISSTWKRISVVLTTKPTSTKGVFMFTSSESNANFSIYGMKVEEGELLSTWTPSPHDASLK